MSANNPSSQFSTKSRLKRHSKATHAARTHDDSTKLEHAHIKADDKGGKDKIAGEKVRQEDLTPSQFARLKTGHKMNVFIGQKGDAFIGIEGAYISLLKHYWGFARKHLAEDATSLFIEDGKKPIIHWIYAYMLAGERDTNCQVKLEALTISQLIELCEYGNYLEYSALTTRLAGILRARFWNTLPNVASIRKIMLAVPELLEAVVKAIANVAAQPLIFEYEPYMELASQDDAFRDALELAVCELLDRRITLSKKYHGKITYRTGGGKLRTKPTAFRPYEVPIQAGSSTIDAAKTTLGKLIVKRPAATKKKSRASQVNTRNTASKSAHASAPSTCYNCSEVGHIARHCPLPPKGSRRMPPTCYNCNVQGHISRLCPASKPYVRSPPTCYNCGEGGHIARNCPHPPASDRNKNEEVRAPQRNGERGSNKNRRRAQNDRYYDYLRSIEVVTNGEGLRTCDRVAKSGEYTRTGLKI